MKLFRLYKYVKRTAFVMAVLTGFYVLFIVLFGHLDDITKADVCVVLGNKVNEDGTVSKRLQARLDECLELYNLNYFSTIIVSGGIGKEGFDEAEVMRLYLISKGVDGKNIITDSNGVNTLMTAKFTEKYLRENGYHSVIIVSQYFHILRSVVIFRKLGIKTVYHSSPHFYEVRDLFSILREMVAVIKYIFI
ncbi:MAG: YdcF family protein [Spirochaetes bacterium]|nr:YdcF family protein [Spirochaetota bacterium]